MVSMTVRISGASTTFSFRGHPVQRGDGRQHRVEDARLVAEQLRPAPPPQNSCDKSGRHIMPVVYDSGCQHLVEIAHLVVEQLRPAPAQNDI